MSAEIFSKRFLRYTRRVPTKKSNKIRQKFSNIFSAREGKKGRKKGRVIESGARRNTPGDGNKNFFKK